MVSFLVIETLFYLMHNLSGAAGRDLPGDDFVLLVASLLGYLNALERSCSLHGYCRSAEGPGGGAARTAKRP